MLVSDGGALQVDGFDLCAELVADMGQTYRHCPQLRFEAADVTQLPVPDHSCDVYVSFETVEHVQDDRAFVAEAARVVRSGGTFLCSTPNRDLYDPGTSIHDLPHNPYHVRQYVFEEFRDLLAAFFPTIEWFGQTFYPASYSRRLATLGRKSPKLGVMVHRFRELCGMFARRVHHYPQPVPPGTVPEIWIAKCTTGASKDSGKK